ncbi:hypothetical protein [Bradyrhizobium sp. WSM2254]|uniref:hypothetical protein n=1 Tax=Bradyrhizobium sp. WSM2254 TaxID=1188263 RepID=UPI000A02DF96|nr:hypothetical protein [Bradyrhizobium sp. WSM2254]
MTTTRRAIAALVAAGLALAPVAVDAKRYKSSRNYTPVMATQSGSAGLSATTQPRTYGSSGQSIGTVTAPSIGTYNWPSVGVTNAVPTWNNTNPPVR